MKVGLTQLLAERPISHPTTIVGIQVDAEQIEVTIDGAQWWEGSTETGRLRLVFEFPHDGCLDLSQFGPWRFDEMLDGFTVVRLADTPWALEPTVQATYCSEALPDPLALFAGLHDQLGSCGAPWGPFAYLNGGPTLTRFRTLTSRGGYLLSEAPPGLQDGIVAELRRQGVAFNVLTHERKPSGALAVRLNGKTFVCGDAFAEWGEV